MSAVPTFGEAWAMVDPIPGWLTRDQAFALWEASRHLPAAPTVVEIGSHRGRSTSILALSRPDIRLIAIDPFVQNGRYPGLAARTELEGHLSRLGVRDRVRLMAMRSAEARALWVEPVDLVWIDGKHDAWSTAQDLRWASFLPPGGEVLIHDAFSSVGVTLTVLGVVLPGRRLSYQDRTGSLIRLTRTPPQTHDRLSILAQLPWFARNVAVKVALRTHLPGLARLWGHSDSVDPY